MNRSIFSAYFWRDAFERMVKAAAAALLGVLGADKVVAQDLKWGLVWWTVGIAAGVSVLSSIVSAPASNTISPASVVRKDDDRGAISLTDVLVVLGIIVLVVLLAHWFGWIDLAGR